MLAPHMLMSTHSWTKPYLPIRMGAWRLFTFLHFPQPLNKELEKVFHRARRLAGSGRVGYDITVQVSPALCSGPESICKCSLCWERDDGWRILSADHKVSHKQEKWCKQRSAEKFTMKTLLPSPGAPSTTIIPPLLWATSTISTALANSLALPKNCLCSAPWCAFCSLMFDSAVALSSSSWIRKCLFHTVSISCWNRCSVWTLTVSGLEHNIEKRSFRIEQLFSKNGKNDLNKLLHNSRPHIFKHSPAKDLQVFQIGFPIHNTSPLTWVTIRENRQRSSGKPTCIKYNFNTDKRTVSKY